MTKQEIFAFLKEKGSDQTKKVLSRHGAQEPIYGVKVADLKIIQKKIKVNQQLASELYKTGNSDAMYLAGLIADPTQMTKNEIQDWLDNAYWYMLSEYTVPWVASESKYGQELAHEWIHSDKENIASAGWATYSNILAIKEDSELSISEIERLLDMIKDNIHESQNRVRYTMNGFVISVATYIKDLNGKAMQIAESIGKVIVYMGETSCKVPFAPEYIQKVNDKGLVGKKRKKSPR